MWLDAHFRDYAWQPMSHGAYSKRQPHEPKKKPRSRGASFAACGAAYFLVPITSSSTRRLG
jgi:hypothetical protein